jgi:hypothetical protein
MMKAARDIMQTQPDDVCVLDTTGLDLDAPVTLMPAQVSRRFWRNALDIALGDLADLVAPETVVLCEGTPNNGFDADCYRAIFNQTLPDVEFLSVGNAAQVTTDSAGVGAAIEAIAPGTKILLLRDRDDLSADEAQRLRDAAANVRILSRRHIESYLLDDDVLTAVAAAAGSPGQAAALIAAKEAAMAASMTRGNPSDDVKSAAGDIYNAAKSLLSLTQQGSNHREWMRSHVAPLVSSVASVYDALKLDIFG